MGFGKKLGIGVGATAGIGAMMPILLPILILVCCCSSSISLPSCISSSVLFGDLRSSKSFQKAKEHFNEKKKPMILNQKY
jgi:hypothetical protein